MQRKIQRKNHFEVANPFEFMYNEYVKPENQHSVQGNSQSMAMLVVHKNNVKEALPLIQVIAGKKGSGKTKRIIDMANLATKDSKHDIVFIDDDNRYMFDLRHEVRFINASEYDLSNDQMFMGLLYGIVAQNFDVGLVCIDAFKKLIKNDLNTTEWFFQRLEAISEKHDVNFAISISADAGELPGFIKKYVI